MEAFRFLADKDKPTANDQFPGWPFTISQADNDGRKPVAYLPRLEINKPNQVIKIIHEGRKELMNAIRIQGAVFQPGVYAEGSYTIQVGEGKEIKELKGIKATPNKTDEVLSITV